jgi:cyanophycinase
LAALKRDLERHQIVKKQIREIEQTRLERLEQAPAKGPHAMVLLLARVIGVGVETADMLVQEVLSRTMRDRRAVGRYAGLTGAPDESGAKRREKGLARSGNARVRRGMIQLAWRFLLFQKDSALAQWYRQRTADSVFADETPRVCISSIATRPEDHRMRPALLALSIALATTALAQTPLPSHGPAKGYLVITGGAPDYKNFLALAGGKDAHIVVIPTAAINRPEDEKRLPPFCSAPGPFAGLKCTVLHTTDRKVADSPAFVAPLRDATGVYLEGGRHWRLADAYLGTLTLKEIFALLDRGGAVMGGSAGATIQGSFMVRGSSDPDDNTIMMAPGHLVGFGLFTNATIDQHVDARGRENDLAPVMKAHPELLGIGLDESTSITVHGDTLTCNGPRRAAIWDGKDHDGKGYYYLRAGDTLNTATRVATLLSHPPVHGTSRSNCPTTGSGEHRTDCEGDGAAVRRDHDRDPAHRRR